MIYVRPLHAKLMGTTALTPTQHKGGFKALIGIAVAIAIPFAAPAIATAIGFSGSLLASTLVGAALGAATAGLTGGNVLLGAAGGGLGGFAGGGGFSGLTGPAAGAGGGVSPLNFGPNPVQFGGGVSGVGSAGLTAAAPGSFAAGLEGAIPSFDFAGAGATFTGGAGVGAGSGATALGTNVSGAGSSFSLPPAGGAPSSFAPPSGNVTPLDFSGVAPIPNAPAVLDPTGGIASAAEQPSFFSGFGDRLSAAASKAFSPDKLLEVGGKFALSKLSEAFADEVPVSREEEQRLAFLDQQRAEQVRLQGVKEGISNTFLTQAGTISPLQRGQELLALEQDRLQRAQQAGLRNINPRDTGAVASQQRKDALNKARLGGFQRGQEAGTQERERKVAQAAATLPTGAGIASGAATDLAAADRRFLRLQQEQKNFSDVFGGLLPTGAKTAEERRKDLEGVS